MASVGSAVQSTAATRCGSRRSSWPSRTSESPLYGVDADDVVVRGGRLHVKDNPARGETYQQLLARNDRTHLGGARVLRRARRTTGPPTTPTARSSPRSPSTRRLGLVRVRRMLGVYDAGRIISPKLADSQAIGGMVGGIGAGPAGAHGHRPPRRPDRQRQPRRLPRPRQRRHPRPQGDLPGRARTTHADPHRRQGPRRGRPGRGGARHRQRGLQRHRPPRSANCPSPPRRCSDTTGWP